MTLQSLYRNMFTRYVFSIFLTKKDFLSIIMLLSGVFNLFIFTRGFIQMYKKFSENLIFPTPWYTHVRVGNRG